MGESIAQFSMAKGELSPNLYDRVDLQWWSSALKTCRNFIVQPYGGVKNRPGMKFVVEAKTLGAAILMVPFRFSASQSYALEFGNLYIRIIKDGGQVVYSSGLNIGDPVEVASPYTTAELVELDFTQSADVMTIVHPDHAPMSLSRTAHDAWALTTDVITSGPWQEMNVDKTSTVYVDAEVGSAITVTASKAIFTDDTIGQLFYLEQRNYGQPWEPGKVIAVGDVRRSDSKYYKALNAATTGGMRPTHYTDVWNDGAVDWEYLHSGYGVVRIDAVAVDHKSCTAEVLSRIPSKALIGSLPASQAVSDVDIAATALGNIALTVTGHGLTTPGTCDVDVTFVLDSLSQYLNGTYYYEVIDANTLAISATVYYTDPTITLPVGTITVLSGLGSGSSTGTFRWKFGAWNGGAGFPRTVSYHQGRRVYGATPLQPNTVWLTRSDAYDDFSVTSPLQDDDAISLTLASSQLNEIRGLLSSDKLLILTAGAEWILGSGQADVMTPTNFAPRVQGFRGSSTLKPLGVGDISLYVQDKGQVVRDLGFSIADDRYTGMDLTVFANHLVEGKSIISWAYQQHPFGIVWMVRSDGVLLGLTYLREQQVIGWHRHDTDGVVESVTCISEAGEDALYLSVKRTVNGVERRYIERLHSRLVLNLEDAVFLDSSLTFDGTNTTATTITVSSVDLGWGDQDETLTVAASAPIFAFPATTDNGDQLVIRANDAIYRLTVLSTASTTSASVRLDRVLPVAYRDVAMTAWSWARNTFAGLDHLAGKTISALGDGNDLGSFVVSAGGVVTLTEPVTKVCLGLNYFSDLETLSVNTQGGPTLSDKKKAIRSVRVKVLESQALWAGRNFDDDSLYEHAVRVEGSSYDAPVRLQDGLLEVPITTGWSIDGSVAIRQKAPLPLTITSIIPEVEVGGV